MIVSREMAMNDFLYLMELNKDIYHEFAALSEDRKRHIANVNMCTGTAESFFDEEGKLFAVGGVRYVGLGEMWMALTPEARKPSILKITARTMERLVKENHLWRCFAETRISGNFLEHLGMKKQDMYIWTRS